MSRASASPDVRNCIVFSHAVSVLAVLVGALALLGWLLGITALTSILPRLASMKPNTASCFVLAGLSLWLIQLDAHGQGKPPRHRILVARILSGLVALVGLLTLAEYIFQLRLGVDELFLSKTLAATGVIHAGRMAGATALGFTLLGVSLLLNTIRSGYLAQILGLLASLDGFVACVGYLLGVQALYQISPYSSMALHTAILFFLLGLAVLAVCPQVGVMSVITSANLGGVMMRRVMPLIFATVIFLGWLRWRGQVIGIYGTEFGIALLTLGEIIVFFPLFWISALRLNQIDEEHRQDQAQKSRLAAIVESSNDGILSKDLTGIITSWNRGAEQLYGYREAEIVGKPITTLIPSDLHEDAARFLKEIASGRIVTREDTLRLRKDGSAVQVSLVISPIRDADGQIVGASSIAHDITERKRVEDELRHSEDRYRDLVEHSQDLICTHDLSGKLLSANPTAARILGYSVAELLAIPMRDIVVPEFRAQFDLYLDRIEKHGADRGILTVLTRTGERRIWEYANTLRTEGVETPVVRGMARDVTEKVRARVALKESERQFRTLGDSIPQLAWMAHSDGSIHWYNQRWYDYTGTTLEQMQGWGWKSVHDPVELPKVMERWQGSLATGEPFDMVFPLRGADGVFRPFLTRVMPIKNSEGRVVQWFGTNTDISEQKRTESALRESEEKFRKLFETSPVPIYLAEALDDDEGRPNYRYLDVNPSLERLTGIKAADLIGRTVWEATPFAHPATVERVVQVARTGVWDHFEGFSARINKHWEATFYSPQLGQCISFLTDVTERKQAEQALRESEEKFRTLADSVPQMIWISTPDGSNTYINRRWVEYTGLSAEETSGIGWSNPYHDEDKQRAWDAWNTAVSTGQRYQVECRIQAAGGSYRWFLMQVEPLRDASGSVVKWFGSCTDIEDTKQAEIALREYERVVEGLEEMILVVDRDYRYVIANRAFLTFRGFSAEQVVGHSVEEVVGAGAFKDMVRDKMAECFMGKVVQYEMAYAFPNVGMRELAVSYFPIEGPAGIDRIACVLQDVTNRKLAEEALRKSEERFSKAFRNNPLAITLSTQDEGRYLDMNDAFLEMVGRKRQDVIGHSSREIKFWNEPLDRVAFLEKLKDKGHVAKHHTRYRTAKGEIRDAEVWAESIELDGQLCVLGITRDVTEVQQLEAQFRQAQKMEAIGRLAGGMAHDFNNVLGVIMGYSDLSLQQIPADSPACRYVLETKKAVQRAALLTRQLLAFSRKQIVFPKIIDLNEVVQNATQMFLRLVGEDIAVEFRPTAQLGSIKADAGQIEQVLMNLVVNARDAMPTGGKILIETAHAEIDEHYVSLHSGSRVGKHVVLIVSDTGCGMEETIKSQIFDPFFTTKEAGKGTGLGLSTVYGIVKQSESYIAVYSEPGKGTAFKIYFPLVSEKGSGLAVSGHDFDPPRGSENVLVVEDDKNLREITVKLLQDGGYRVFEAKDVEDALRIMADSETKIELLLTDVIMPGKSGVELAREAKVGHPELRSLFMSGYDTLVARQGVVLEEVSFLEKPFTKRSLLAKVYSILHGNSSQSIDHGEKSHLAR